MDKLQQIDKLLKVKELRRKLAELEAAKARSAAYAAQDAVNRARQNEQHILEDSERRRQNRVRKLMDPDGNPAVQNARALNVYKMTDHEIAQSRNLTSHRMSELDDAENRSKMEQQKLARFLQLEERTRKLCERLVQMKRVEAARIG